MSSRFQYIQCYSSLVQAIITFATESYAGHIADTPMPPVGTGIGLCFALFALQLIASWCTQHFSYRSMACGVLLRGGLITAIYSRALSLSPRARVQMTNGRLVNHISTDVSRIDFCLGYFHMSWTVLIQLTICLILLLINLGPSALAGFALLIVGTPINAMMMKRLFSIRIKSMAWTDKRSKLLQEMLSGIRVIKFFSWEVPFLKRIAEYRKLETVYAIFHVFLIPTELAFQLHTDLIDPSGRLERVRHFHPNASRRNRVYYLLVDRSFFDRCECLHFS